MDPNTEERQTSVREDLVAAFEAQEVNETETGAVEDHSAGQTEEPAKEAPAEDKAPKEPAKAAAEPAKEEPKPDGKLEAPARWTKEEKEEFEALDPGIQRILLNRNKGLEGAYTKQMQQIAQERQRYNGIEQALAPHRQSWNGTGWDDATALKNIMGYWQHAQSNPMEFIEQFAQARGLDLASHFAPSTEEILAYLNQGEEAGDIPQAGMHPDVARQMETLKNETQQLRQQLQQQQGYISNTEQQRMQATRAAASRELEEFQSAVDENGNPKYEFLDDLRSDMAQLLGNGLAQDLSEAYDKAMWMRPDIRQKVTESMQMQQQRELERKIREEGARAKAASASVVGATSTPVPSDDDDDGDGSVRSILERQWRRQLEVDI